MKRRRRCIRPSALSWGLHSSCRGRPMILFTIFILADFWKLPCILYSIPGIRANSFKRTGPIPFQGFSSTPKLLSHGGRLGPGGAAVPAREGGGGRSVAPRSRLSAVLSPRAGLGSGGYAARRPRPGGAGRAGRAAPPGRAPAGGAAAAAAAPSGRRGRPGPIKAGPRRGGRGGSGAAPRGGWWPS